MRKVLLFGTSGNPPTGPDGHSGIVEYFVSLRQFDELWVLPVYHHMFAAKRDAMADPGSPSYEDRIEMCRLAFERHSTKSCRVRVRRTEQEVFTQKRKGAGARASATTTRSSTYDVVKYLRTMYPDVEFSFLLGTDTYQDLRKGKWRNSKELLDTLNFVIVDRLGVREDTEDLLSGLETHHPPMLTDISSTKIRSASARELLGSTLTIDPPVLQYMHENHLYGFGRQSWLDRTVMDVCQTVSTRWLTVTGTAGLLVAVGAAVVAVGRSSRGGRWV